MATGTAGTDARELPFQAIHYMRMPIAYNTTSIGTDSIVKLGTLPAGAAILWVLVRITTAFNAGTNNHIDVGTVADDDAYVDGSAGDVDATTLGGTVVWRAIDHTALSADTPVYVTYNQSGTAASAGAADIILAYIPNNDQR